LEHRGAETTPVFGLEVAITDHVTTRTAVLDADEAEADVLARKALACKRGGVAGPRANDSHHEHESAQCRKQPDQERDRVHAIVVSLRINRFPTNSKNPASRRIAQPTGLKNMGRK